MKIFVLGNINAGKSYAIERLCRLLPDYTVLQIDEYRKKYCDGSIEKEEWLWSHFAKDVLCQEKAIVEFSGGGKIAENIISGLTPKTCIVLKILEDVSVCLNRIKTKDFSATPYPKYPGAESLEETIIRIDNNMKNGIIENTWETSAIKIFDIKDIGELEKIPFIHYEKTIKLINLYKETTVKMFSFGSLGRGELNQNSDVDLFLLSEKDAIYHSELLEKHFDKVSVMGNEVVIREDGVLIELDVIREIKEAECFYSTGNIKNVKATIIFGDTVLEKQLNDFKNKERNICEELKFITERLNYYVLSLPPLMRKGDEYKYFFHNNIIVHEYVKLKAILAGVIDYNYLPRMAKQYLTDEEWNKIIYSFGDDMIKHYEKVKLLSDEIIRITKQRYSL